MNTRLFSRAAGPGLFLLLGLTASAQPSRSPEYAEHSEGDRVQVMGSNRIDADEKITGDVRAIMGSNSVAGYVTHDVVAVMGSDTIDGTVGNDVVAVMGSITVNGTVDHTVRAVMGNVTLGPDAVVKGDVLSVGGTVHREPGAIVRGRIITQGMTPHGSSWGPKIVWNRDQGTSWGEIVHDFIITWRWVITLGFLGVYALLALVFPGPVRRCGDVLVERPGLTLLVSFAALMAVPLVFFLLLITIIGIPVAIFLLPASILLCTWFGKAGFYGILGRSLGGERLPIAGAVLLGGALCSVFYFIPLLGFLIVLFISILGFGCGLTALLTRSPGTPAPAPGAPPLVVPAPIPPAAAFSAPASPAATAEAAVPPASAAGVPTPLPPAVPIFPAALPRAGFWIRMAALFIDSIIVTAACGSSAFAYHPVIHQSGFHVDGGTTLLPLAVYGALMWKLKGTTIGGMVCGLRVVRLDDKAVEWETAIVRALACFLSMFLWLGFIWIAFDAEKQAWHDKIAGTVVVRTKGVALV